VARYSARPATSVCVLAVVKGSGATLERDPALFAVRAARPMGTLHLDGSGASPRLLASTPSGPHLGSSATPSPPAPWLDRRYRPPPPTGDRRRSAAAAAAPRPYPRRPGPGPARMARQP